MAQRVRIVTGEEYVLPQVFSRSPSEIAAERRRELEKKIKIATPPAWWYWYQEWIVPNVLTGCPGMGDDDQWPWQVSIMMTIIFGMMYACLYYSATLDIIRPRQAHPFAVVFYAIFLCVNLIVAFNIATGGSSRRWGKAAVAFFRFTIPGSRILVFLFDKLLKLFERTFEWGSHVRLSILQQELAQDQATLAKTTYDESLEKLSTELVGPSSRVGLAIVGLREQLTRTRAHVVQLERRIAVARKKTQSSRVATLERVLEVQASRVAALTTSLEELEGREARARAFLDECRIIVAELSEVAGDEVVLRQIREESRSDAALIDEANDAGQELLQRLSTAYTSMQRELAERELDRITGTLAEGSVEALLDEPDSSEAIAATKNRTVA